MFTTALLLAVAMSAEPARLLLAVKFDPGPPTAVEQAAVAEAARIWAPYGVAIVCSSERAAALPTVVLRVSVVDHSAAGSSKNALGSILFTGDHPQAIVSLYAGTAWHLLSEAVSGVARWPDSYRDATIGRVLGRALAHETGHLLLESRMHSGVGLMQANQPITRFMDEWDRTFTLSRIEQRSLNGLLPVTPEQPLSTPVLKPAGHPSRCGAA